MKKYGSGRIAAALLWFGALTLSSCGAKSDAAGAPSMPPPQVEVASVVQENVRLFSDWVATLDGSVNAQIQPQVSGYLVRQNYREGAYVRQGDVLFDIDPRPFQAIVDQAKGQLAQAEGQVAQAQSKVAQAESQVIQARAQFGKAELDVRRDTPLAKARAIAQSQLESEMQALAAADANVEASKANVAASQAEVKSAQAAVVAARANVAQAELNLGFTHVRSLIDGIAGMAHTQIGNLVKPDTILTTVSQLDPIRVYFPISEKEYMEMVAKSGTGEAGNILRSPQAAALELILTNGAAYGHKGRVIFADRSVDPQTGTIRIAAAFPNPGNVLRPGQFGRIRALTGENATALLIPQRAVTELQGKYQVAVVGDGNKVQIRSVVLGPTHDSRYIVREGLKAGERVVVEGLAKAMDGGVVAPQPVQVKATASLAQGR